MRKNGSTLLACLIGVTLSLSAGISAAETRLSRDGAAAKQQPRSGPAFEVNVLWPFFPGGMSELKLLFPVVQAREQHGELLFGLHSDFGWRFVREKNAGNVAFLAGKLGYRQFFIAGLHAEVSVNAGHRQQRNNPYDGSTLNSFAGRLWGLVGYQWTLNETVYLNARGGGGLHLFRTDRFASTERTFAPAGDVNLGFRL